MVIFGVDNLDYLLGVEEILEPMTSGEEVLAAKIPVVLHGTEDVSGEISGGFLLEYMLFRSLLIQSNALKCIDKVGYSTPLTVK